MNAQTVYIVNDGRSLNHSGKIYNEGQQLDFVPNEIHILTGCIKKLLVEIPAAPLEEAKEEKKTDTAGSDKVSKSKVKE